MNDLTICKDMEKSYFFLSTDTTVLCNEDGEPYHFETREQAEQFLNNYEV